MPFNRLFREEAEADSHAEEDYANEIRVAIAQKREELEIFRTPAWLSIRDDINADTAKAMHELMVADGETLALARERVRVLSNLTKKPERIEEEIARLVKLLHEAEGS